MSEQDVLRKILVEIDRDPEVSQKSLSEKVGLSVGSINWHIKRCVNKGLVKMQRAPMRRYLYYLTPEGFTEKAKLTASFVQISFDMFRTGREQYGAFFELCHANDWRALTLLGKTELTELALLVAARFPELSIIAIIDEKSVRHDYRHIPIFADAGHLAQKINAGEICASPDRSASSDNKAPPPISGIDAAIACQFIVDDGDRDRLSHTLTQLELDRSRLMVPGLLQ